MVETSLGLDDDLTTSAAGRDGFGGEFAVGASGGDGQCDYWHVGVLCAGSEDCGALGAEPCGERGILLVTTNDASAVLQFNGSTYVKI